MDPKIQCCIAIMNRYKAGVIWGVYLVMGYIPQIFAGHNLSRYPCLREGILRIALINILSHKCHICNIFI